METRGLPYLSDSKFCNLLIRDFCAARLSVTMMHGTHCEDVSTSPCPVLLSVGCQHLF